MDHSPVLESYVNDQLVKIEEFLKNEPSPVYLDVVLEADPRRSISRGEIRIKSPHYDLISNFEVADMYDVIDRIIDVMYKMLRKKKKELVDQRKTATTFKGA